MFERLVESIQNFSSASSPAVWRMATIKEEVLSLKIYGSYPLEAVLICFEVEKSKLLNVRHAVSYLY